MSERYCEVVSNELLQIGRRIFKQSGEDKRVSWVLFAFVSRNDLTHLDPMTGSIHSQS